MFGEVNYVCYGLIRCVEMIIFCCKVYSGEVFFVILVFENDIYVFGCFGQYFDDVVLQE